MKTVEKSQALRAPSNLFKTAKRWLLERSRAVGYLRLRESRFSEAVRVLNLVVSLAETVATPRELIGDLVALGVAHQATGNNVQADAAFERVIALSEQTAHDGGGEDNMPTMIAADLLADRGRFEQAELLLRRGILKAQEEGGEDCRLAQIYLNRLASTYIKQNLNDAAEEVYLKLVGMAERTEPGSKNEASALNSLAWFFASQTKFDRAEPLFCKALKILDDLPFEPSFGRISTEVATLHGCGTIDRKFQRHHQAVLHYKRAVAAMEKLLEPNNSYMAKLLEDLAAALTADGCIDEALAAEKRAEALRDSLETIEGRNGVK
jgi:tetratricopeptide (TPR) repeat protein